jgi:hypothetical protein
MNREPALTLLVETDGGVFLRPIAHALPLGPGADESRAAEEAVESCAAVWGLPDFVYRPIIRRVSSGSREIGDRILLIGGTGVVIQIKRRVDGSKDAAREKRWIRKAAAKGLRQGLGTIRALSSRSTTLMNGRGREITLDPRRVEWIVVIIIDHDDPPEELFVEQHEDAPHVVLLRRDWEFLFDQLRSTHAVVQYLKRASGSDPVDIGREPVRYYELAAADAATPPSPLDPRIVGEGFPISAPLLPQAPVGAEAHGYHRLLRIIMEDIATSPVADGVEEEGRLSVLSEIDRLPVAHRAELGELLLSMLNDVANADSTETKWRFRRFRFPPPEPQLGFGACSRFSDLHMEAFRQWVTLRHHEFGIDVGTFESLVTVGVLLTPRRDGRRPWDTTMVRAAGDFELTEEEVNGLEVLWNRRDESLT